MHVKLDLPHKSGFQKVFKNHDPVLYDLKYRNKYCRYDIFIHIVSFIYIVIMLYIYISHMRNTFRNEIDLTFGTLPKITTSGSASGTHLLVHRVPKLPKLLHPWCPRSARCCSQSKILRVSNWALFCPVFFNASPLFCLKSKKTSKSFQKSKQKLKWWYHIANRVVSFQRSAVELPVT